MLRSALVVRLTTVVAVVLGSAASALATPALAAPVREPARADAFAWLTPIAAPASWRPLVISSGAATLWSPPSFTALPGDPGSATAGLRDANGIYREYLNTTPRQGDEQLRGFAAFRVHLIAEDHDAAVREEARAEHVAFRGGQGSCVMDHYVTRVGHRRYREIACLVMSAAGHGAVIVAAASPSDWNRYQSTLRTAIASFSVV